jgi:hypothetical protein
MLGNGISPTLSGGVDTKHLARAARGSEGDWERRAHGEHSELYQDCPSLSYSRANPPHPTAAGRMATDGRRQKGVSGGELPAARGCRTHPLVVGSAHHRTFPLQVFGLLVYLAL